MINMSKRANDTAKSYAKCLGISTQTFNAIKLVQAYNNEETEVKIFTRSLFSNKNRSLKEVKLAAISIGLIYLILYCYYSYSLFVGGRLRTLEFTSKTNDRNYTGGQVLTVLLCVILGSFDLMTVITHIHKIRDGKRAACSIL